MGTWKELRAHRRLIIWGELKHRSTDGWHWEGAGGRRRRRVAAGTCGRGRDDHPSVKISFDVDYILRSGAGTREGRSAGDKAGVCERNLLVSESGCLLVNGMFAGVNGKSRFRASLVIFAGPGVGRSQRPQRLPKAPPMKEHPPQQERRQKTAHATLMPRLRRWRAWYSHPLCQIIAGCGHGETADLHLGMAYLPRNTYKGTVTLPRNPVR
ncbi:hypothetical protein C8R44DRAFT_752838 [Mycena epipterygia]|nr:hypothetical protein C8R44DRAFT_752838 [Mycena epipterygia]